MARVIIDATIPDLHTTGKADIAGCALSIAYTDDPKVVRPEDFVIFSVQHECVWHRDTVFDIPAAMPPCSNGKCMCSWWWVHHSDGGSDQMVSSLRYFLFFSVITLLNSIRRLSNAT